MAGIVGERWDLRPRRDGAAKREVDVEADGEARVLAGEVDGVVEGREVYEKRRRGDDAARVRFNDAAVDAARKAKIVRDRDEQS